MKFSTAAIITSTLSTAAAFSPISTNTRSHTSCTALEAYPNFLKPLENFSKATLLAGAIWASPTILNNVNTDNVFLQDIQSFTRVEAKEMASGSGSRVNKDPESLLRLGLPIPKDKEVRHDIALTTIY